MSSDPAKARKGPYWVYDPHDMPDRLQREYFELLRYDNGHMLFWTIGQPGGPFGDTRASYTEANYGKRLMALHLDVDVWLLQNGGSVGETILIHHWW
jgi:hypothetical protein